MGVALVIGNKAVSHALGFLGCNILAIHSNCLKVPWSQGISCKNSKFQYKPVPKKLQPSLVHREILKTQTLKARKILGGRLKNKGLSLQQLLIWYTQAGREIWDPLGSCCNNKGGYFILAVYCRTQIHCAQ